MKFIKQQTFRAIAAVMLAITALVTLPVSGALAFDAKIRIFKSADGKFVLICHYDQHDKLLYCDAATAK